MVPVWANNPALVAQNARVCLLCSYLLSDFVVVFLGIIIIVRLKPSEWRLFLNESKLSGNFAITYLVVGTLKHLVGFWQTLVYRMLLSLELILLVQRRVIVLAVCLQFLVLLNLFLRACIFIFAGPFIFLFVETRVDFLVSSRLHVLLLALLLVFFRMLYRRLLHLVIVLIVVFVVVITTLHILLQVLAFHVHF